MPSHTAHPCPTPVVQNDWILTKQQNQQNRGPSGSYQLPPASRRISVPVGERDSSQGGSSVASTMQSQNCNPSSALNNSRVADITQCITSSPSGTQRLSNQTATAMPHTSSWGTPASWGTSTGRVVSIVINRSNMWVQIGVRVGPGSYHLNTRAIAIGPVLPLTPWHFNFKILGPIKFLSSYHISTWSICRLCRKSRSFTSSIHNNNPTNTRSVDINNPWFPCKIVGFFQATPQLLVGSPIWKRGVKERLILYNLRIDHVTIQSQLI